MSTENPIDDIRNLCFIDFETRAEDDASANDGNVKNAGTYRYTKKSFAIIFTYSIGGVPAQDVSLDRGFDGDWLCWDEMPAELHAFHARVTRGEAWYAAWNTGFDRNVWNNGTFDFPHLDPEYAIDVMAQAVASGLPAALEGASQAVTGEGKQADGKFLISKFCSAGGWTPQSNPLDWDKFKSYGRIDTDRLVDVYKRTRVLPWAEWEDYWVSERINERGTAIDLPYVERCAAIAAADHVRINAEIVRLTNGQIKSVNQHAAIADWVWERADETMREMMVKVWDEDVEPDEDGQIDMVPVKIGIDRRRIERIVTYLESKEALTGTEEIIHTLLVLRMYGGSASPKKFQKMIDQHDGGRLKGQYVFNGANQTGRFSSKGVQVQNLTRSTLGKLEPAVINFINGLEVF